MLWHLATKTQCFYVVLWMLNILNASGQYVEANFSYLNTTLLTDNVALCYAYFNFDNARLEMYEEEYVCAKNQTGKLLDGSFGSKTVCRPTQPGNAPCPADHTFSLNTFEAVVYPICECGELRDVPSRTLSQLPYSPVQLCMQQEEDICYAREEKYMNVTGDFPGYDSQFAFGTYFGCPHNTIPCNSGIFDTNATDYDWALLLIQEGAPKRLIPSYKVTKYQGPGSDPGDQRPPCYYNGPYGSNFCFLDDGDAFSLHFELLLFDDIAIEDLGFQVLSLAKGQGVPTLDTYLGCILCDRPSFNTSCLASSSVQVDVIYSSASILCGAPVINGSTTRPLVLDLRIHVPSSVVLDPLLTTPPPQASLELLFSLSDVRKEERLFTKRLVLIPNLGHGNATIPSSAITGTDKSLGQII